MGEGLNKIINSKSKTFLAFCFCFVLSSGAASFFEFGVRLVQTIFLMIFVILAALVLIWSNRTLRFVCLCLFAGLFGAWRYGFTLPECQDKGEVCSLNGQKVTVVGVVSEEPIAKIDKISYIISVTKGNNLPIHGKVNFTGQIYPEYFYGDELSISCYLGFPKVSEGNFRFDKYLARSGAWSVCSYASVKLLSKGNGNVFMDKILHFKSALTSVVGLIWSEPESSLMAGILYGGKSALSKEVANNFSRTGVSHIVAVSGFNISIITIVLMQVLLLFGLYRKQAFYFSLIFITVFIVLTGLSASAVRAGVMGMTVLFAQQLGRNSKILNVIIFTVAVMQLWNPYFLFWDVGFQLSFFATVGLVYISPLFPKVTNSVVKIIYEPLVSTLAAIISTLPLIMFQFGTISLIAPLVNILILWTVPYLMLFGVVSVLFGSVFLPFGKIIGLLAHFGMAYVIMIVQFFGNLEWSSMQVQIPFWFMVIMYLGIILTTISLKKYESKN